MTSSMNAEQLLKAVFEGTASLKDVEVWIEKNKMVFERPNLNNFSSLGKKESGSLLNTYSDREINTQSMRHALSHASQKVFELGPAAK